MHYKVRIRTAHFLEKGKRSHKNTWQDIQKGTSSTPAFYKQHNDMKLIRQQGKFHCQSFNENGTRKVQTKNIPFFQTQTVNENKIYLYLNFIQVRLPHTHSIRSINVEVTRRAISVSWAIVECSFLCLTAKKRVAERLNEKEEGESLLFDLYVKPSLSFPVPSNNVRDTVE